MKIIVIVMLWLLHHKQYFREVTKTVTRRHVLLGLRILCNINFTETFLECAKCAWLFVGKKWMNYGLYGFKCKITSIGDMIYMINSRAS